MRAKVFLSDLGYNDIEKVKAQIENYEAFHACALPLMAPDDESEHVGIMFSSIKAQEDEMIFVTMRPEDAIFFGKSLIALGEHIRAAEIFFKQKYDDPGN